MIWTTRLVAEGGRSSTGALVSRASIDSLAPRLRAAPVRAAWIATDGREGLGHPDPGAPAESAVLVGHVTEVAQRGGDLFGLVSIDAPPVEQFLLRLEREGRLIEAIGLSVFGCAVDLPPEYGGGLWFSSVLAVDLVDSPQAGGCFIQSDVAMAAGRPWPPLPTLRPAPRVMQARPAHRVASSAALCTEFRVIREGEDY